ncbi:hypothetical protein SDC9_114247 [bioreactor metagenome]|uniref:Uncharacterized protein n=1 Tax=bioreactor metagenome TaxID=1076179 RepID=A0A645BPW6_9ZZZZ
MKLFVHTATIVLDADASIQVGFIVGDGGCRISLVRRVGGEGEGDAAFTLADGINTVDDEIEYHLGKLGCVAEQVILMLRGYAGKLYTGRHQAIGEFGYLVVELGDFYLVIGHIGVDPAEGGDLLNDFLGLFTGLENLFHLLPFTVLFCFLCEQHA